MLSRRDPTAYEASILVQAGFKFYDGRDWWIEAQSIFGKAPAKVHPVPFLHVDRDAPKPVVCVDIARVADPEQMFIYTDKKKKVMVAVQAASIYKDTRDSTDVWICQSVKESFGEPWCSTGVVFTMGYLLNEAEVVL